MAKYIKPTLDTQFHIDFAWWQKQGQELRIHLQSHACAECRKYCQEQEYQTFDWVDSQTGEVFQLDLLWYHIAAHCGQEPDFIEEHIPLTTAIFRAFIANNNTPLTPVEIHQRIRQKSPTTILGTIGGRKIYNGIRPVVLSV
ncbi:MAG: hypothetical protein JXM69_11210 [Anaerolineae bacterium]|nr:hypothetical protein [Anaerolineae bacterium]